jgi:hypothetical protein
MVSQKAQRIKNMECGLATPIARILSKCVLMGVQDEALHSTHSIHIPFTIDFAGEGNVRETMRHARSRNKAVFLPI